ncbi:MAG: sugar ABC transporter ATP-binding protein [Alphaproteobacteria bacterium]
MTDALLEVRGAIKDFPGVRALDNVSMRLEGGQIHALLGENGAGKSTLIKILTGVHRPDAGDVLLRGESQRFQSPRDAIAAGISVVHQERNLINRFSVGENILLETLPTKFGLVDYDAVFEQAKPWLEALDLQMDPRIPVGDLSAAQMQLVEIAKALSLQTKILLLDEPTASITPHETESLFKLLNKLRDDGVCIVFVSHKLEEVFALCDRVTVLRDGRNACESRLLKGLSRGDIVKLMIGREEQVAQFGSKDILEDPPALRLYDVGTGQGHRRINLTLHKGEILGLYGLIGSGRSELAKAVIGAVPLTAGYMEVNGQRAQIRNVTEALSRYRIGYVSEDRKREGLILIHSVLRNVSITVWDRVARLLGLTTERAEANRVMPFIKRLDVRTPSVGQTVGNLSGGNQQKVSVAKWLAAEAEILIIDEPTIGIDIKTKTYLHELIWGLAADGAAILLISSDMPEMIALADRILVMNGFALVGEIENSRDYDQVSHAIMDHIHDPSEESEGESVGAPALA